jgi:hypothetical protein
MTKLYFDELDQSGAVDGQAPVWNDAAGKCRYEILLSEKPLTIASVLSVDPSSNIIRRQLGFVCFITEVIALPTRCSRW